MSNDNKWTKKVSPTTGEAAWSRRGSDDSIVFTFKDPEDPANEAGRKKAKVIIDHINELNDRK
tara:strand:+ start:695 stop:883 length:189 start_codon:yes stop_codon:yes gene_type:complete